MGKFNFDESPVKKVAQEIREDAQPEHGIAAPISEFNKQAQTIAQPATVPTPATVSEVMKNVGAKIPYSVYDRLERIKRQSERSGIKADKRNIGDLIAQAIAEFVERNYIEQ